VVHLRRNAQVAGNMQMIVGRLEIFDPSTPRYGDRRLAEQVYVGRGVGLQRSNDYGADVVRRQSLRAENILRKLLFGAHDLRLWIAEKSQPGLVDDGQILRRP